MSQSRLSQWVVCYDISDDAERRHVEKLLLGWGFRVQRSVFLITTTRAKAATLKSELEHLGIETGFVLLIRRLATAAPIAVGEQWTSPDAETAFIF